MKDKKLQDWQQEIWDKISYVGHDDVVSCKLCGSILIYHGRPTTKKGWKDLKEEIATHKHNEDYLGGKAQKAW